MSYLQEAQLPMFVHHTELELKRRKQEGQQPKRSVWNNAGNHAANPHGALGESLPVAP